LTGTDTPKNGNGNAITETIRLGEGVVKGLPGQFLALCVVNIVFIGGLFWYEGDQNKRRAEMAERVFDTCFTSSREAIASERRRRDDRDESDARERKEK
jgi:hypothetical protein